MRETFSLAAPPVLVAAGSHVGRVRETNEDRVYADPERGSFAVIDGVGGQAAGEQAAQTALDTIRQRLQLQIGTPAERVREAIALANDEIRQQALIHPDRRGMACVLTLVLLQSGGLTAGHVGDTRLYKMRGGVLRKLTHDHSPIGEREDRGELSETEAMRHPRRNEIYREVGLEPRGPDAEGFIDIVEEPFEPDAALLLCSDGLSDSLSSSAIAEIIHRHAGDPTTIVDQLIAQANDAGGKDNVSVVYIEGTAFASTIRRGARSKTGERGVNGTPVLTSSASASAALPSRSIGGATGSARASDAAAAADVGASASADARPASAGARPSSAGAGAGASKVLLFVVGLLAGVAIALGVAYAMRDVLIPPATTSGAAALTPRTLVVGASADATYRTIGQAMAEARAGDTIQLAPGEYREQVVLTDGVTLTAAAAREAVLRAPAQVTQPWTAIIIPGDRHGSRVSGLRIAGDAQAPIAIGIHVLGRATIDDVEVSGTTIAGIALADGSMSVTGASVHDNAGPGFTLNGGEARLAHTVLARNGAAVPPGVDIVLSGTPRVTFTGNVLTGDPAQRVRGLAADQVARFREANIVLPPPAAVSTPRPRAATPRRAAAAPVSNR
jgi:serine/threonine protein phosphatase PrpC